MPCKLQGCACDKGRVPINEEGVAGGFQIPLQKITPYFTSVSAIEQAAGPMMTTNSVGRMNRISGTVMMAGRRAAFSSARIMRSLRNSAESTRREEASGVPYFSV